MMALRCGDRAMRCADESVIEAPNPATVWYFFAGSTVIVGRFPSGAPIMSSRRVSRFFWSPVDSHACTGSVLAPAGEAAGDAGFTDDLAVPDQAPISEMITAVVMTV